MRRTDTSLGSTQLASAGPQPSLAAQPRLTSLDALRGLVMIVMALDHVRDFFHQGAMSFQPDDLTRTTTALFFTRWITHFCAPVFVFLAGASAYLWWHRNHSKQELSRFLWTRGLWLVLLEVTAVRLALTCGSGPMLLTILWAIGWSMVILAMLVYLPSRILLVLSVGVIALHNLLDGIQASSLGSLAWCWTILHQPGMLQLGNFQIIAGYPLVPWFAVMAAGFCFGRVLSSDVETRHKVILRLGVTLTLAFLLLRVLNIYGDPQRWSSAIPGTAVLSFLKCTKYPPSLDFLLMTLGPALLLLLWFERLRPSAANPLLVFGRVPLFYFIAHLYVAHALLFLLAWFRYGTVAFLFQPLPSMGGSPSSYPAGFGWGLPAVYAIWVSVVILLYPACRWFGQWKRRRKTWWVSYL